MYKNRNMLILTTIMIVFSILTVRFFYLQIYAGKKLSKSASIQRMEDSEIDKPRGEILDRNNIPFTNRSNKVALVLQPLLLKDKVDETVGIFNFQGINYDQIKKDIELKKVPIIIEINPEIKDKILSYNIQGISAVNSLKRYDNDTIAKHILGYLNRADQIGETGIEKAYEDILNYNEKSVIGLITDAKKNAVQGLGYRIVSDNGGQKKMNVKLTMDYHIQSIVEDAMKDSGVSGAVVVEDVYSGDIVAIASKPDYNQNEVGKYLHSGQNELFNRAVASYNIGSAFKIVVAAQAFESKTGIDNIYYCAGSIRLGDKEFKCSSYEKGGHGSLNMREALALSCNTYFIELGLRQGAGNIIGMARKFGFGNITGIKEQGVDESAGNIPDGKSFFTNGDIANMSIGQGNIMATPLQVADMVATVANGGIKNKINIVDSIVDEDRNKVKTVRSNEGIRIISKDTADKIKRMMEDVTSYGTGVKANLDKYGGSAGKTGSAEAVFNGRKAVHAWFAGYFPRKTPKYAISVFVEDGKSGGQIAAPIFTQIAEEILKKGY